MQRLLLDLLILVVIAGGCGIVKFVLPPYKRGYFCNDNSIRMDYRPSTTPTWATYVISTIISLLVVWCFVLFCDNYLKIVLTEWHTARFVYTVQPRGVVIAKRKYKRQISATVARIYIFFGMSDLKTKKRKNTI